MIKITGFDCIVIFLLGIFSGWHMARLYIKNYLKKLRKELKK